MLEVYEVANVEQAVELANKFKQDGKYDCFRGQIREWPPHPSIVRVRLNENKELFKEVEKQYILFDTWLKKTPALNHLLQDEYLSDYYAILQHYGIPTDYIDFTTDPAVAGFFSADTSEPPNDEGRSCIYCLDSNELLKMWGAIKDLGDREGAHLRKISINVDNLWRLQAQKGIFISANFEWDKFYPMDKIVFPYTGYPSYPTKESIYPIHKSELEQLLDQYFSLQQVEETKIHLNKLVKNINDKGGNAKISRWISYKDGFYKDGFKHPEQLTHHDSWSLEALKGWDSIKIEEFEDVMGKPVNIRIKDSENIYDLKDSVSFGVKQVLLSEKNIREKAVDWEFMNLPENIPSEEIKDMCRLAWNGMRRLPYTEKDIGDAFGTIIALCVSGFLDAETTEKKDNCIKQVLGEVIKMESGSFDNSGSRGYVSKGDLKGAMRSDLRKLLNDKYKNSLDNFSILFQLLYNPKIMFVFEALKKIYSEQYIPTQILFNRKPIHFNPVELKAFGLP